MNSVSKKLCIASVGIMMLQAPVWADNDHPISVNQLPQTAQVLLRNDFGHLKVAFAEMEKDLHQKSYEVKFSDGSSIEFDKKGEWTEISCKTQAVPRQFIPVNIQNYVQKNWEDTAIMKIERDRKHFEIELANEIEITFDKNGRVIDIDD